MAKLNQLWLSSFNFLKFLPQKNLTCATGKWRTKSVRHDYHNLVSGRQKCTRNFTLSMRHFLGVLNPCYYFTFFSQAYLHLSFIIISYIVHSPAWSWDLFVLQFFNSCGRGHWVWNDNVIDVKCIVPFLLLQQGTKGGWWHRLCKTWGRTGSRCWSGRRRHHSRKWQAACTLLKLGSWKSIQKYNLDKN